ncbi:hypothetical protein FRC19_010878 [Serendipita sp. 401]|nr:hypothetical protein FRC19_010878 [Serendipita sp. 401]KAG9048607.1 hypothetical protein FS842_000358 [Serendipita sp. 407]
MLLGILPHLMKICTLVVLLLSLAAFVAPVPMDILDSCTYQCIVKYCTEMSQPPTCLCNTNVPTHVWVCAYSECNYLSLEYLTCDEPVSTSDPGPVSASDSDSIQTSISTPSTTSSQPSDTNPDHELTKTQTIATVLGTVFGGICALEVIWRCIKWVLRS